MSGLALVPVRSHRGSSVQRQRCLRPSRGLPCSAASVRPATFVQRPAKSWHRPQPGQALRQSILSPRRARAGFPSLRSSSLYRERSFSAEVLPCAELSAPRGRIRTWLPSSSRFFNLLRSCSSLERSSAGFRFHPIQASLRSAISSGASQSRCSARSARPCHKWAGSISRFSLSSCSSTSC